MLIIIYLLFFTLANISTGLVLLNYDLPSWLGPLKNYFGCSLVGGIGGGLYCLRATYLHKCALKDWSTEWQTWYYLRPFVSMICGAVSYLFLQASLLILEADTKSSANEAGFYALAFVAGFNSSKFLAKIEDVASAVFGIEKSRAAQMDQNDRPKEK